MMLDHTQNPLPPAEFGTSISSGEAAKGSQTATGMTDQRALPLTRLLLRLALVLIGVFTAGAVVIQLVPYDDSERRAFLLPPAGCPAPCWQGIRPGVTTVEETITMLEAQHWELTDGFDLERGDFLGKCQKGHYWCDILATEQGIVRRIALHSSHLNLGEIRTITGAPDNWFVYETMESFYIPVHAAYADLGYTVGIELYICDFTLENYWRFDAAHLVTVYIGEPVVVYSISNKPAKAVQLDADSWSSQLYRINFCRNRR